MHKSYDTGIPGFTIRQAGPDDTATILSLIRALAVYEKMEEQAVATEEELRTAIFQRGKADVILAEENGRPVGFALFFENFSTFVGRENMYLEDLFVLEECRGRGYGAALFRALAAIAVERGCKRLDWSCLDWNESSIAFYKKMGAVAMDDWTVYRLEAEGLRVLAGAAAH